MATTRGRVTLPSEANFLEETKELMARWGADAIRDSNGTKLPDEIKALDADIYTTYFVARNYNDHAEKHMDELQQLLFMSKHTLATDTTVEIDFMDGYFDQQFIPDYNHNPKEWWEIIDRTTEEVVSVEDWDVNKETNIITVKNANPFHEYTASFFVYAIWDGTHMYNHITNNWGDVPHDLPFDVRMPNSRVFMNEYLERWLKDNPDTDVIRFTTFFYHFTLVFNNLGKEKFVDWFGYGASVSVAALEAFEKEMGYKLRPEDIVDKGYYNTTFRIPTKEYLDYMEFTQRFVSQAAKELVDKVHVAGKEAMMFLGDNWIGTEPYGDHFKEIGLDAVVGSVGGGSTLRMISEIPHVTYTEGRFLPYFFPDEFYEGNDPSIEAEDNWLKARRGIMRKPVDRIGYGGYLSLAYKFPKFVDYIEKVTDEFRLIYDNINGVKPYAGLKVAILNAWGKTRSWQTHMVAHALWYKQIYSYLGILESLSGASVDVSFISFDDVKKDGVPTDIDVIINAGDADTAFSGGYEWQDPKLIATLREWIYKGGGFVGVGEPSATEHGGHFFQLADALGVDKELGFSLSTDKYFVNEVENHFIKEDIGESYDFGEGMKNIYATKESTQIIRYADGEVNLSSNDYGKGRAVYIAGLPYSQQNTRLLMRSLFYAANKEEEMTKWYASNINCEVHAYLTSKKYAILNNSIKKQTTLVYDANGNSKEVTLEPGQIIWEEIV